MDKRALECVINECKKDSLLFNYISQVEILEKIVNDLEGKSGSFEQHYFDEVDISKKINQKLIVSKKWNTRYLIAGPLVGLFFGILISN